MTPMQSKFNKARPDAVMHFVPHGNKRVQHTALRQWTPACLSEQDDICWVKVRKQDSDIV